MSCENKTLKTGYIDINEINKEYKLAIQFEKHIKSLENSVAGSLLGVQAEVNLLNDSISYFKNENLEPPQNLLQLYFKKRTNFDQKKAELLKSIQDSVVYYRELLNQKINDEVYNYAQLNGFHYVYSPAGSGAFMYADSNLNITNKIIAHLNSK